jgi:hypothetical protein
MEPTTAEYDYDLFLSHASANKYWVEVLANNLKQQGLKVFYDEWSLVPGGDLVDGLYQGLQRSRAGVLVVSPEAANSGWVGREWQRMVNRRAKDPSFVIVPVVYDEVAEFAFLEDLLWVDFRPAVDYRRAFHRLLCGLEGLAPGPDQAFEAPLEVPGEEAGTPLDDGAPGFFADLFTDLGFNPVQLLLAQADRAAGPVVQALLEEARGRYGATNVHHLSPAFDPRTGLNAYFALLARQCGLDPAIDTAAGFEGALHVRLADGEPVCLLVTGFENGPAGGRRRLAGMLRGLADMYPQRLRVVLCGSAGLAELKYADGELSMLNVAREREWPELGLADVRRMSALRYPEEALDDAQTEAILAASGGHPRLIRLCLERRHQQGGMDRDGYTRILAGSRELYSLFTPYKRDAEAVERICAWLGQDDVGPSEPYIHDELLRRLYWHNLLRHRGERLCWRCGAIRHGGKAVLRCG